MRVVALNMMRGEGDVPTACEIYRINMPFSFMNSKGGHGIAYFYFDDLARKIQTDGIGVLMKLATEADVIVFPRTVAPNKDILGVVLTLIEFFHRIGIPVVYEVDDDLSNETRDIGFQDAFLIAKECDAITVTTQHLAKFMTDRTGVKSYVLPNMIDSNVWDKPESYLGGRESLVIGLSGSKTHYKDWEVLKDVFPQILANSYDQPIEIWLTAFHPDYFDGMKIERLPPLLYGDYANMVRECDIILAPVIPDDAFNACKSPIKITEGMAATRYVNGIKSGAACIASNATAYNRDANGSNARLVQHTPEMWYDEIDSMIRDRQKRHAIQRRGHLWVYKQRAIGKEWKQWETVYRDVMKTKSKTHPRREP